MTARRRWTPEEDAILRAEGGKRSWREVASMVGRSRFSTARRAHDLRIPGILPPPPWTPEEIATLRRDYPVRTTAEVAAAMGRGPSAVNMKARELGLVKTRKHISRVQSERSIAKAGGKIGRSVSTGRSVSMGRPWHTRRFDTTGEYSPTQDAARHLQRIGPIWRCDADGTTNPKGDHWKFCGKVMDADAVETRAARAGWVHP